METDEEPAIRSVGRPAQHYRHPKSRSGFGDSPWRLPRVRHGVVAARLACRPMDMGESLVGAYYRSVVGCQSVTYNTFLPNKQGEIDVIGLRLGSGVEVFAAEVAIHLESLQYGTYPQTVAKVAQKMRSAREFTQRVYAESELVIEFWSPVVPKGLVSQITALETEIGFHLVANAGFTERVRHVVKEASQHTKMTGEPACRMLQMLAHLRGWGARLVVDDAFFNQLTAL